MTLFKLNGTLLTRNQWMENARLCYGMKPIGICTHCNGCGTDFTVKNETSYKKGGLVGIRHDDTQDEARGLEELALTPGKISYEPTIKYGGDLGAIQLMTTTRTGNAAGEEARDGVLVHGL